MAKKKLAASGIDQGAEVVYTITVGGLDNGGLKTASAILGKHGVTSSLQHTTPATASAPGHISVPRLLTRWRGDEEEAAWTQTLRAELAKQEPTSEVELGAAPRAPLPGYPMGELAE